MKYLAFSLVAIGILNFACYVAISLALGGDAVNGKIENGHFYLGEHGHFTEVSSSVYGYSRIHTHSVWITHPLAFVGGFLLYREEQKSKRKSAA